MPHMMKRFLQWMIPGLQFVEPPEPTSAPEKEPEEDDRLLTPEERKLYGTRAASHAYAFEQPANAAPATMDSKFNVGAYGSSATGDGELAQMRTTVPSSIFDWFVSQTFIGFNVCAHIAQHWLVDKACSMPGRDAIRQGYEIKADNQEIITRIKELNKRFKLDANLRQMIHFGRIYGQRLVLFRVMHTDPLYYEKPFNVDAIGPGMYVGMSQIDPQWISPELTGASLSDPTSPMFYEPEYYRVWNMRVHRSHFHKYVPFPVVDILKPRYMYGGVSVPQRIYERVYAAERTANEAPILVMTKRLNVLQITATAMARFRDLTAKLIEWCFNRDNHGILTIGDGEKIEQHDTSLTDVDTTMMTQYQLVAAAANIPSTKLLQTQPKGFNASGEYEEAVYREELESIQTNDFEPVMERHHECCMASEGLPGKVTVSFEPLDSPTATEWATINKTRADTAAVYIDKGVITAEEEQKRLAEDKNSDYHGLELTEPELMNDLLDDAETDIIKQDAPELG